MPSGTNDDTALILGDLIQQCVREGLPVQVDGLGTFRMGAGGLEFIARSEPRVFLAYVEEDLPAVRRLYEDLLALGCDPWLDKQKLLPGQDWPRCIERAIAAADFFVPCLSQRALRKRGQFQRELRMALDCAAQMPLDDIYLLPARLEPCEVPRRIRAEYQYVDLFPEWGTGVGRLVHSIRAAMNRRRARS